MANPEATSAPAWAELPLFRGVTVFELPKHRRITIVRHDCIQGMKRLEPRSVDLVVTSPPYNLGKVYTSYDDTIPRSRYLAWVAEWADGVARVLSEDGSFFLNIGGKPKDPWVPFDVLAVFRQKLRLQNVIHWVTSIAIEPEDLSWASRNGETVSFGHYQPINSRRFLNQAHEYVFHFTHGGHVDLDRLGIGVPYQDKSNVSRWKGAGNDLHCRGNTWFIPYETIHKRNKDRPHPATFPVKLPELCMRVHGIDRIRLAMDPFLGLGSSAEAAANLGVSFLGFEIDPEYARESCLRVQGMLGT